MLQQKLKPSWMSVEGRGWVQGKYNRCSGMHQWDGQHCWCLGRPLPCTPVILSPRALALCLFLWCVLLRFQLMGSNSTSLHSQYQTPCMVCPDKTGV